MEKSKDPLPDDFDSLEEFWVFWDTHSTADYEDEMEDVDMNIQLSSSQVYCPVSKTIAAELRQEARHQGIATETLVNLWLQEKLLQK